jgi:ankyrin repeat protein
MSNRGIRTLIVLLSIILLSTSAIFAYTLLNKKKSVDIYSKEEQELILEAFQSRNVDSYRQYLSDGSKLSFVFPDGETPVEKLINNNDFVSAERIIDTGFDLNLIEDHNPIDTLTLINSLNEGRYISQIDTITIKLIEQVKDQIEKPDDYGYSFLINAMLTENQPVIEEVLKYVKDIDKVYNGYTALTYSALNNNDLEVVKLILEKGADVNYQDEDDGYNALMNAVMFPESEIPEYLILNTDINVNATSHDGQTILHLAAEYENYDLVKLLLEKTTIDRSVVDEYGDTAYDIALNNAIKYGDEYLYDEIAGLLAKS